MPSLMARRVHRLRLHGFLFCHKALHHVKAITLTITLHRQAFDADSLQTGHHLGLRVRCIPTLDSDCWLTAVSPRYWKVLTSAIRLAKVHGRDLGITRYIAGAEVTLP